MASIEEDVGVVAGIGMTVTVEGEEDGASEGEATVASTADVEVASGVEVGTEGDSGVEALVTGATEVCVADVVVLSVTPVMALEAEEWLDTGKATLDDGATSDLLPCPGVTVIVTTGLSVTVTISESQAEEPKAPTLEPLGLPA